MQTLTQGTLYRVTYLYQQEGKRARPQEMVVKFMALESGVYYFDGRPGFGTVTIDTKHGYEILSAVEVEPTARKHLPRGVRATREEYEKELRRRIGR
jgi:hypothetical protein